MCAPVWSSVLENIWHYTLCKPLFWAVERSGKGWFYERASVVEYKAIVQCSRFYDHGLRHLFTVPITLEQAKIVIPSFSSWEEDHEEELTADN